MLNLSQVKASEAHGLRKRARGVGGGGGGAHRWTGSQTKAGPGNMSQWAEVSEAFEKCLARGPFLSDLTVLLGGYDGWAYWP